ncbi:S-adenosyl-L-methionine-dependent methyltransferase [Serendipita vermifera]|nr:S-adenosyl-L-methionine-dependent methyltransferase [Serendipita vermifera]
MAVDPNPSYQADITQAILAYSYRRDDDPSIVLKEAGGRTINSVTDQYFLPTDNEEWNRLHKQHVAITLALNGLYPAKETVRAILAPQEGQDKSILDLGCGTGVWAVEMAKEFPWAQVVGVDLAPCPIPIERLPSNSRFEIHDINAGLARFENQFDVVHLGFVGSGLKDFAKRMKEVHSCLKPGGIVLWLDMDYCLYYTKEFKYTAPGTESNPEGSWMQRQVLETYRSVLKLGSNVDVMLSALDAGLWSDPCIDPETCRTANLFLPAGNWVTSEDADMAKRMALIGTLIREDMLAVLESVKPVIVRAGWPVETVDEWIRRATVECTEMKNECAFRAKLAWGRRRAGDGGPATPLPIAKGDQNDASMSENPMWYPYLFVYDSEKDSLE